MINVHNKFRTIENRFSCQFTRHEPELLQLAGTTKGVGRMIPCIAFNTEISNWSLKRLLEVLQGGPNTVFINSPGGTVDHFHVVGPALQFTGFTAIGGTVESAAVILHMLGHKRLALPDSTFFFHEVRTFIAGQTVTLCDVKEYEARMERFLSKHGKESEMVEELRWRLSQSQAWLSHMLSTRSGVSASLFLDLMRNEARLSAEEARRLNIVHRVISHDEFIYLERI